MEKNRVAIWDNMKFLLILSVVIGHTIYDFRGEADIIKGIYLFIYTYHMPAFIFVAGLFSKGTVAKKKYERILEFVIIYLVMKFLDTFGSVLCGGGISRFHLFWEDGPGWFALAMAAFLLGTMIIKDLDPKYVMITAVLLGCLAGLDSHLGSFTYGNHFAALRILVFYPVFLAGYYLDADLFLMKGLNKGQRIALRGLAAAFLAALCAFCIIFRDRYWRFINFLKGKDSYRQIFLKFIDDNKVCMGIEGVAYRFLCYVFWAIMILAIIMLCTNKEHIYTWIGTRTMSIFIWHKLIITIVMKRCGIMKYMKANMPHTLAYAAICAAVIICIISAYLPEIRIPSSKKNR